MITIWQRDCFDVLRAMQREPRETPALLAEFQAARGINANLDRAIEKLEGELSYPGALVVRARSLTERNAITLQVVPLSLHTLDATARAFRSSRLSGDGARAFGTLSSETDFDAIQSRACPI